MKRRCSPNVFLLGWVLLIQTTYITTRATKSRTRIRCTHLRGAGKEAKSKSDSPIHRIEPDLLSVCVCAEDTGGEGC
uniref:Putative secreted protein n=1 Tax=Anopheles darlingi TaxID=43151 RepID=A0A2M4D4R4_ANODA